MAQFCVCVPGQFFSFLSSSSFFFKGMMKIVREHIQTAPPKYDQIQRPINKSCHTICCTVIHSSGLQNGSIILIHHSRPRYGHNVMKLYTIESEGNHFHWTQNKQRLFDHGPKASLHSLPKPGGGGGSQIYHQKTHQPFCSRIPTSGAVVFKI